LCVTDSEYLSSMVAMNDGEFMLSYRLSPSFVLVRGVCCSGCGRGCWRGGELAARAATRRKNSSPISISALMFVYCGPFIF
ncbi:hypothetical protein Q4595_19355, partial [Wenyingzhuangia sp. 1_MG-2023]|nr:hypothetical protein [Wenyingzhuangia sp. 1_MG-2023]